MNVSTNSVIDFELPCANLNDDDMAHSGYSDKIEELRRGGNAVAGQRPTSTPSPSLWRTRPPWCRQHFLAPAAQTPTRGCGGSPTTVNTDVWKETTFCLCFIFCSQMRRLTGCSRFKRRCPTTSMRSRLRSTSGLLRMLPRSQSTSRPSGTVNNVTTNLQRTSSTRRSDLRPGFLWRTRHLSATQRFRGCVKTQDA